MSEISENQMIDDARARRAVPYLVWAQAVLGAQMTVHFILGGLVGMMLAEDKSLATLPITMIVFGAMISAPVMSWIMGRWGRRAGFLIGAIAGAAGGALAAQAVIEHSFTMLLVAGLITGIYMAAHNFYRFAAADLASRDYRPKAIGWVLAGGLVAAMFGPQLVIWFKDALAPVPFAGAYQAMVALNVLGVLPLLFLDIPLAPHGQRGESHGRKWQEILSQPRVTVAILCAMIAYALMNLVMTSTPLAMVANGFSTDEAARVVSIHVLAMFGPSFITGPLITRYRSPRVIAAGLVVLSASMVVAISGVGFVYFAVALALLGIGWNLSFIGATTMLAGAHLTEERARVQGLNDFMVMGMVTLASLSSGALMSRLGWQAVNLAAIPFLMLASISLIWLFLNDHKSQA